MTKATIVVAAMAPCPGHVVSPRLRRPRHSLPPPLQRWCRRKSTVARCVVAQGVPAGRLGEDHRGRQEVPQKLPPRANCAICVRAPTASGPHHRG